MPALAASLLLIALGAEPRPPAARAGESRVELDLDRDGKAWRFVRRGGDGTEILVRVERDPNGDGRVRIVEEYGADGRVARVTHDFDGDGKPDEVLHFEKGQLVRKEHLGADGRPQSWTFHEQGKLVRRERALAGKGKPDYWEYWEGGELDRVGFDRNGDGKVEQWESRRAGAAGASAPQPVPSAEQPAGKPGKP